MFGVFTCFVRNVESAMSVKTRSHALSTRDRPLLWQSASEPIDRNDSGALASENPQSRATRLSPLSEMLDGWSIEPSVGSVDAPVQMLAHASLEVELLHYAPACGVSKSDAKCRVLRELFERARNR